MGIRAYKGFIGDDRGAVAATYALALIPLVAAAGLAWDYTRMAGMDTELQNAADQAALAGASQLDRTAGSMERAIAAAQGGLVANATAFSNDGVGADVSITDATTQITFYPTKADAEAGTNGFTDTSNYANARFIEVTVDTRAANYSFTPIVGALKADLNGSAVAGMGSALCRIPPLMVCNPDEADQGSGGNSGSTLDWVNRIKTGVKVVEGPTGSGPSYWKPGDYGFLDLGAGADAVAKGLGWLAPEGICQSVDGNEAIAPDTEPGLKAGAIDSLNTRFDIYQNTASCKTGGECPASFNSRKDLVRDLDDTPASSTNACSIHNDGWHEVPLAQQYLPSTASALPTTVTPFSMGHPRDMCHAVSAAGSCTDGKFGDGNWDRDAYFRSHYIRTQAGSGGAIGEAWDNTDWNANVKTGTDPLVAADFPMSRYRLYLWEIANEGTVIDGVTILATDPAGATGSDDIRQAKPICSQQQGFAGDMTDPDRRVLTIAIVNCEAEKVRGKTKDVAIAAWADVFLVQPSADRERTSKSDIYFEIIRENLIRNTGNNNGLLVRRDVPYLVK